MDRFMIAQNPMRAEPGIYVLDSLKGILYHPLPDGSLETAKIYKENTAEEFGSSINQALRWYRSYLDKFN